LEKLDLFDLDGTLTESHPGILRCAQYALKKMGYPEYPEEELRSFIGPPLDSQFREFAGMNAEQAAEATRLYRERFRSIGIYENALYPGIPELLEKLSEAGHVIGLATSKPEEFAVKILEHFGIRDYFSVISAVAMSEKNTAKSVIVGKAIDMAGFSGRHELVTMIGDRRFDMEGAKAQKVRAVGAVYGYGTAEELMETGADVLAYSVKELEKILL